MQKKSSSFRRVAYRVTLPLIAIIALAGIIVLFQLWFSEGSPERVEPAPDRVEVTEGPFDDPFLRFAYGALSLERDGEEIDFGVGDVLRRGDRVTVGEHGMAEVQYADAALLRIDGPARLEVGRRVRTDGTRVLLIDLMSGSAIVRGEQDVAQRRVRVRTDAGVVESESTTYLVSREETGETIVSVARGRVRVLPSAVDPEDISDLTAIEDIVSVLESISDTATFVDADGEMIIRPEDVETSSEILRDMKKRLERYGEAEQPDGEELQTMRALMAYARDRIAETQPQVTAAAPERLERIDELRERRMLSLEEDADVESPSHNLSKLYVETDPPDAEVLLDGLPIGGEIFASLFEPGETVTLTVRKQGYESEDVEITFGEGQNESILVRLDRLTPTVSDSELVQAIERGDVNTVEEFLATGGDPDRAVLDGYTPLALAFGAGKPLDEIIGGLTPDTGVVRALLEGGANPDTVFGSEDVPESSLVPLSTVILSGLYRSEVNYELVDLLLDAGASPNIVMETGEMRVTPLALPIIVGIERGEVETPLIERLLEAGSDPSRTVVYEGRLLSPLATALALGADHGYDPDEVVSLLVSAGARIERRVRIGGSVWTPLDFAEEAGLHNSARVLRERGV